MKRYIVKERDLETGEWYYGHRTRFGKRRMKRHRNPKNKLKYAVIRWPSTGAVGVFEICGGQGGHYWVQKVLHANKKWMSPLNQYLGFAFTAEGTEGYTVELYDNLAQARIMWML